MDRVSYSDLDPALRDWSERHGLHVFTRHRDDETRAVMIVDDAGDAYSLVAAPAGDGLVGVGVAVGSRAGRRVTREERASLRYHEEVPLAGLGAALEACYREVESWIESGGHTRPPV